MGRNNSNKKYHSIQNLFLESLFCARNYGRHGSCPKEQEQCVLFKDNKNIKNSEY